MFRWVSWVYGAFFLALLGWTKPLARLDTVPFVGCPADGQGGYIAPPQGAPKAVTGPGVPVASLAYYKGDEGPGVFAPRGWHCQAMYGSAGSSILVTREPIDSARLFSGLKIHGPAVELVVYDGGTSGRFPVATYASKLFPAAAAKFIAGVKEEGLVPDSELYVNDPHDSVSLVSALVASFATPPGQTGLGTRGYLATSPDGIRGVAVLDNSDPAEPQLWILRVRVSSGATPVSAAILRLNESCMKTREGC